ncbi:unnamed protein product, partial [Ectocarpus sp. 12 AP-2014]
DWFIGSILRPGRAATIAACLIVREDDGHWYTWCALFRTFTATQCIATVLCSFAMLVLAVPAGSRRFARHMGIAMRVLLACSVFFQLVAVCLAASVYVHLRIHHPYHDGRVCGQGFGVFSPCHLQPQEFHDYCHKRSAPYETR